MICEASLPVIVLVGISERAAPPSRLPVKSGSSIARGLLQVLQLPGTSVALRFQINIVLCYLTRRDRSPTKHGQEEATVRLH
jgi:hypothetical protein